MAKHTWQAKVVRYNTTIDTQHLDTRIDAEVVACNYLLRNFEEDFLSVHLTEEEATEVINLINDGNYTEAIVKYNRATRLIGHAVTVEYVEVCEGRLVINFAKLHESLALLRGE